MKLNRPIINAVIDFIEAFHTATGEFPGRSEIRNTIVLATPEDEPRATPQAIDELLEDQDFIKSLDERGINAPWTLNSNAVGLTREQLAVAATLNNIKDRRSDSKKLADLGISARKFAGWMHDKKFSNYMKISANNLLENMEAEAHLGLLRSLQNNNTQAQKLYFEMTGRYNPAYESGVNMQVLMTRFIEIIQKHVHEPEQLQAIAADLQLAAVETGYNRELAQSKPKAIAPPVEDRFKEPPRTNLGF